MEHNRSTKVVAIIALLVGVLGLSVGFSAYSKVLNIQNVQATVQGNASNFQVVLSTASGSASEGTVTGSGSGTGSATLTATEITNLTATFGSTQKGDIVYKFYVYNPGNFTAYLKSVTIGTKSCAKDGEATDSLVQAACADITAKVKVGELQEFTATSSSVTDTTGIAPKKSVEVTVTINNSGAHPVDGNFKATFGPTSLNYSTAK